MWVSEQKTFGEKYQPQRKNCCLDTVYLPAAFGANVWHTICLESRHRQSSDVHVWFQLEEALHSYDLICAGLHMAASYTCHLTSANMDWWQEIAAPYTEIEESQISQRTGNFLIFLFFIALFIALSPISGPNEPDHPHPSPLSDLRLTTSIWLANLVVRWLRKPWVVTVSVFLIVLSFTVYFNQFPNCERPHMEVPQSVRYLTDLSILVTVYILSNIISVTGSDEDEELREAAAEEKQTSPSIYINSR